MIYGLPSALPLTCQPPAPNRVVSVELPAEITLWALLKGFCAMNAALPLIHGISFQLRIPSATTSRPGHPYKCLQPLAPWLLLFGRLLIPIMLYLSSTFLPAPCVIRVPTPLSIGHTIALSHIWSAMHFCVLNNGGTSIGCPRTPNSWALFKLIYCFIPDGLCVKEGRFLPDIKLTPCVCPQHVDT